MRSTWIFALGLAIASPAFAQTPTTEAGAQALADQLSAYFGKAAFEKKIVAVAPEGAGYRITFAPNAAIAPLLEPGAKVDISPYSLLAAERSDGNWDVSSSDPIAVVFDVTAQGSRQTGDYRIDAGTFTGIYSPKLGAFVSGTAEYPGGRMKSSEPMSDMDVTFGKTVYDLSGKDVGGALDFTTRQAIDDFVETITVKADPEGGTSTTKVDVTAKSIALEAEATGFKSRALLDLWAFGVSRADQDAIIRDQEMLRTLLGAALPILNTMKGGYVFNEMGIETAFGNVEIGKAAIHFDGDGISRSTAFSYGVDLSGLSAQSPMMPAWAEGLVPKDLALTLKLDGLDLETPAKRAIAEFDLSKDPVLPVATTDEIGLAFSENPPRLTVEPSSLKSRDLEVTMQGDFLFAGVQPEMNMTFEAAGLDKAIASLQAAAATDPSVNEIVGSLALAKGFAKQLPDGRSQWIVSTKADGSVILNGNQIVAPTAETGPAPTDENALPTEDPAPTDGTAQPN